MKNFKNKNILAVMAHPDDDAFGPAGTIIYLSKSNNIYEVLLTTGQSGENQKTGKKENNLGDLRKKEAEKSAKILGIKKIFFLDYFDGSLSNNLYHEIAEKIDKIIKEKNIQVLLTYEPRGVSGHIDHVFMSMISSFLALKNKLEVLYYCLSKDQRKSIKDYFIYFPSGYKKDEIDFEIDITEVIDQKIQAINCHQTQIKDATAIIKNIKKNSSYKKEYFLYKDFRRIGY